MRHARKRQATERTEGLESAIRQSRNVSGEADTQEVEGNDFARCVIQSNQIDRAFAVFQNRLRRSFCAVLGKVPQEGIARSQRKESQGDALRRFAAGKDAVQDFMGRSISSDGEKLTVALIVSFARKLDGMSRASRSDTVHVQPVLAQTSQRSSGEFRRAAATGGRVHDGEKSLHRSEEKTHKGKTAAPRSNFARRSAKTFLLIFKEAVRGKSSSRRTTP